MRYAILLIVALGCRLVLAETPELLNELTSKGIVITAAKTYVVPAPGLREGQDAATRKQILDDFAGGQGWKNFSRQSVVAPVSIDVAYIKDADGARIGHSAHSAFIVHAPLETLKNEDLMKQMFGQGDQGEDAAGVQFEPLTPEKLAPLGITATGHESYGEIQMPLLSRVIVRGVIRTEQVVTADSVAIAWVMDPRFAKTDPARNTWAPIERNEVGKKQAGKPRPYAGAGGYLCVSRLPEIEGASFVESHLVLHEPQDWFRGTNVLRSKLPILMQESARSFRRKLMEK